MNGVASFAQLKMEYYIGALHLDRRTADPQAIIDGVGPKRMSLRVTAERWPAMRFAQQWNQLILINNDSALLNRELMNVLAFTSFLKEDLVLGDELTIDLTEEEATVVSLNGTPMLKSDSAALFSMLLKTWIGPRPPSSDFKRAMLVLPTDSAGSALLSRYESLHPAEERVATTAGWTSLEPESNPPAPAVATAADSFAPPDRAQVAARVERPEPVAKPAVVIDPLRVDRPDAPAVMAVPAPTATPKPQVAAVPVAVRPEPAAQTEPAAAAKAVAFTETAPVTVPPPGPKAHLKALLDQYNGKLRQQVYQNLDYPRRAVKRGVEGLVVIRVTIASDGRLVNLETAQSADRLLDGAAQRAIERSAPFPALDVELPAGEHAFLVPFVFKLTE